jgi:DNA-binding NtrC family response regulator
MPLTAASIERALPSLRVVVVEGPDAGKTFQVAEPRAIAGRAATAEIRLTDPTVSQFHAELVVTPLGVEVTDLGSHNGTRLGEVLLRNARVPYGAILNLGSSQLELRRDADFAPVVSSATSFGELVGDSRAMREVYTLLERLSRTDLSILVEGETGTGKELAARGLHAASPRANAPLMVVDCTAIAPSLAESVLFGHERGAFTGAVRAHTGVLEAADGGTLFFDEIGDLAVELQPKLLRVLERREVVPVGSTRPRSIDVRVVSATWRDLRAMVNAGTFREDLYFRLAQARVRLPALRERAEDIKPLVQHALGEIPWSVRAARAIENDALETLASRRYAGNVRELKSTVERLAMLADGPSITMADLVMDRVLAGARAPRLRAPPAVPTERQDGAPIEAFKEAKRTLVDDFERDYLARLLARAGTNVSRAASLAGIERQTLRDLLKKHGLRGDEG